MRKLFVVIFASLLTAIGASLSTAADVVDEQYRYLQNPSPVQVGVTIGAGMESFFYERSLLYSPSVDKENPLQGTGFCSGLEDRKCSTAKFLHYSAILPPCASLTDIDCIESVYAVVPTSPDRIKGFYRESIAKVVNPYKADPENGLPQGSVEGVWEIPNVKHGGNTSDYVAIVARVGEIRREGAKWISAPPGQFTGNGSFVADRPLGDLRAAIFPTNMVMEPGYKAKFSRLVPQLTHNSLQTGTGGISDDACASVGDGKCALRQPFPENVKFGMAIRLSKVISGWVHGRIDSPNIDYEVTSYGSKIDIQGEAMRVPVVSGYANPADLTLKDTEQSLPWVKAGENSGWDSNAPQAMDLVSIFGKALKDKALTNPSQWSAYSLPERDIASANECIKSSRTLAGLVTTNSTTYTATPPIYNASTGSLDYKVASLHFLPAGKVFQGTYDLYIDSKVARCIYKFSDAPISATVSITSSDGGQQSIATTVVSENSGWLHLSARGFTFSSPTLQVKLTQKAAIPTPKASPTANSPALPAEPIAGASPVMPAKTWTLTCTKGKMIKKITGLDPRCPIGFKKK
jgi:hypothetical protein